MVQIPINEWPRGLHGDHHMSIYPKYLRETSISLSFCRVPFIIINQPTKNKKYAKGFWGFGVFGL